RQAHRGHHPRLRRTISVDGPVRRPRLAGVLSTVPLSSIVELASRLVATPSCASIDPPQAVLGLVHDWLQHNGLWPRLLADAAVLVEIEGREPGPPLCLGACLAAAPAGDPRP